MPLETVGGQIRNENLERNKVSEIKFVNQSLFYTLQTLAGIGDDIFGEDKKPPTPVNKVQSVPVPAREPPAVVPANRPPAARRVNRREAAAPVKKTPAVVPLKRTPAAVRVNRPPARFPAKRPPAAVPVPTRKPPYPIASPTIKAPAKHGVAGKFDPNYQVGLTSVRTQQVPCLQFE